MHSSLKIPSPSAFELEHSAILLEMIRAEIALHGAIDFSRYMQLALYAPGFGYYSAGKTKFGVQGDFVTAPELGDVFARCLAYTVAQVLKCGGDEVLEIGAGSGVFAADLLNALAQQNALPKHYRILETSADLRQRQAQTIQDKAPDFYSNVQWLNTPPVKDWNGVLIANEVIDALPVRLFSWRAGELFVRQVAMDGQGRLVWKLNSADELLKQTFTSLNLETERWSGPYQSEVRPQLQAWIHAVSKKLKSGLALFIDYGYPRRAYYAPDRNQGTLSCHYQHRVHSEPLVFPGLQDITASVDFTALAEAGAASDLTLAGYSSQAQFLIASGLPQVLEQCEQLSEIEHWRAMNQVRRLTLPNEMGELFQVMVFARDVDVESFAFTNADIRRRLF